MFNQKISRKMYIPENKYEEDNFQRLVEERELEKSIKRRLEIRQVQENERREHEKLLSRIQPARNERYWTEKEIEYLKSNIGKLTQNEIASHLNRSRAAVDGKMLALKLRPKKNMFTPEDIEKITAYYKGNSPYKNIGEISRALGRSPLSISSKAALLGVREVNKKGKYKRGVAI